ncbi:hypothetical protein N9H15_02365 [bacterium]|nr:hypothetical protein [bacterium]
MEQQKFNHLLLNTAFSCMACDGVIDKREVILIKSLSNEKKIFGEIDINAQLDKLLHAINIDGHQFLRDYFSELTSTTLSEEDELKIISVSIDTINADDIIEYSEIKFFKIIRSKLKVSNNVILEQFPEIEEFLEQDIISQSYLSRLQDDFFDTHTLPTFEPIHQLGEDFLKDIGNQEEN